MRKRRKDLRVQKEKRKSKQRKVKTRRKRDQGLGATSRWFSLKQKKKNDQRKTKQEKKEPEDVLKEIYYNVKNPNSYSGAYKLYKAAKQQKKNITLKQVKDFLAAQDTYTLHKQFKGRKRHRKTLAFYTNDLHQADLIDISSLSKYNRNYKFLLVVIDVFSRQAQVIPIKNKTGSEIKRALEEVHKKAVPDNFQSDKGLEFRNKIVQDYLKSKHINFYSSHSDMKAAVCERFNRTLKEKMWKYFTKTGSLNYTRVLQHIVDAYNNSKHRSIGVAPNEVTKKNESKIWNYQYGSELTSKNQKFNFAVGDFVRLIHLDNPFTKKYLPRFTKEIFVVKEQLKTTPVTYRVMDRNGETIEGGFYENELVKVKL